MDNEVRYDCPCCGEEIVTIADPIQGERQEYVEDCPVCCRPVVLTLTFDDGECVRCDAAAE